MNDLSFISVKGVRLYLPAGPMGPAGPDGNPIGAVISMIGMSAPNGYLICDGTTYNMADYPELAGYFAEQFGKANQFGGNGTTTFSVPDMRDLFLRGYHGDKSEQLSEDVGVKQNGTEFPALFNVSNSNNTGSSIGCAKSASTMGPLNYDKSTSTSTPNVYAQVLSADVTNTVGTMPRIRYTARPDNMAVLYCIKAVLSGTSSESMSAGRFENYGVITQAEYDALDEDKKQNGMWYVPGLDDEPIQSYYGDNGGVDQ